MSETDKFYRVSYTLIRLLTKKAFKNGNKNVQVLVLSLRTRRYPFIPLLLFVCFSLVTYIMEV